MSLQVAILKVLSSYPDGRASVVALSADLAILGSSGKDWTDRMKRLAARAPELDIFSQRLVLRDAVGWQLTETGRKLLSALEHPVVESPSEVAAPSPQIDCAEVLIEMPKVRAMSAERARIAIEPIRREARVVASVAARQNFAVIEGGKA